MVSTRNHPKNFPPPDASPSPPSNTTTTTTSSSTAVASTRKRRSAPNRRHGGWVHAPSNVFLAWLYVSLPLVFWDVGYMLLRPLSMPGGRLHAPLWKPYALYGTVDYIYGWPAWEERNGFAAGQSWMNVVESALYITYLWIVLQHGEDEGRRGSRGAISQRLGWLGRARIVGGREAGIASLLGFATSVMTTSKTVLYVLQEACSGWRGIGHNDLLSLIFLWIIPNGAWIVLPAIMSYVYGAEILDGLAASSGAESSASRSKFE